MRTLVQAAHNLNLQINSSNKVDFLLIMYQSRAKYFEEVNPVELEHFTHEMAKDIKLMWQDPAIQEAYRNRNEFQLMDGAQ